MTKQTSLTGSAGEHYVLFRLLSLGYVAGLAPERAPNVDIIVTDLQTHNALNIQVKTRNQIGGDQGWHMKAKHENIVSDNLFYFFIDLPKNIGEPKALDGPPAIYILPSKIVATVIKTIHGIWLKTPGRKGRIHKDSTMRRLLPDYSKVLKSDHSFIKKHSAGWLDEYRENWKLIEKKLRENLT